MFDRGAAVVVVESADYETAKPAKAAGLIVIVTGMAPPNAIDAGRLAPNEALSLLESRGVLVGREEQLGADEGI